MTQDDPFAVETYRSCNVLGVNFIDEPVSRCIEVVSRGGLLVVPSGPGLATIDRDPVYKNAIEEADYALADSGYLVLLLRIFKLRSVNRISGLRFIDALLESDLFKRGKTLWLMPRESEVEPAQKVLSARGVKFKREDFCVAPQYNNPNKVEDPELIERIEAQRPDWVVLNVAGGKQEKLGLYLRKNLSYNPAIVCTGAAIAFLSGEQAYIPTWVDRFYLGWLARILQSPKVYTKRYLKAFSLFGKIALNRRSGVTRSRRVFPAQSDWDLKRQVS